VTVGRRLEAAGPLDDRTGASRLFDRGSERCGAHREELGAMIESGITDPTAGHPTTDPSTLVDHPHRDPRGSKHTGGRQSGDARSDDHDDVPHPATLCAAAADSGPRSLDSRTGLCAHWGMATEPPVTASTLIGQLGDRVADNADTASRRDRRDPSFIESVMGPLDMALRWFDPEVTGFEHLPDDGPLLIVGNHSGGVFMPDYWAFLREWVRRRGPEAPLYSLGFDLIFSMPGTAQFARRMGCVPARHANAYELLEQGAAVLVYPGGDEDDYRPWSERHRVDLRHHEGFVRLALRRQVPVVPLVSHGSHDSLIVVFRGDELAHTLGLDKLRIHVLPVVVGSFGLAMLPAAGPPFPAKVISRICEPLDWSRYGPESADDPEIVHRCYLEMQSRMQENLDELVELLPHPVRARLSKAFGFDRLRAALGS
jgi:1-acyl-sn-glycerol-3-phosphate acyltransferase